MHNVDNLKNATKCIDNKWVIARPLRNYGLCGFIGRIKDAWQVILGKADAVKFYKQ